MAFAIEITEVGPAEYPLIGVLHHTIHGEEGFGDRLAHELGGKRDLAVLMAHLEGNPLGYRVGFGRDDGEFETVASGVLETYGPEGVEEQLRKRMHDLAHSRGYRTV